MNEWNIQSRSRSCQGCGQPFMDGQSCHTLLLVGRPQPVRRDLCERCWAAECAAGVRQRADLISYWQGVYQAPPPPDETIKKDTAEALLRKLAESSDPSWHQAVYILAVMLERKRILRLKDRVCRDGTMIAVYEHRRTGEVFSVVEPELSLDRLDSVYAQVTALLERGLDSASVAMPGADGQAPADGQSSHANVVQLAQSEIQSEPGLP